VLLAEIDTQDASMLVCNHFICPQCGIIDRDYGRLRKGYCCNVCGSESESGSMAFPISIHVLVDLVRQAYHSTAPVGPISGPQVPDIGTVLFFCTLREALLNAFLINHLRAQRIPKNLIDRLLEDNKLASQKFGDLFTSVIGEKWNDAVFKASEHAGMDFRSTSELMRTAASLRNEFLHEGRAWAASHEFATTCVNSMPEVISLFVALHNGYVHPLLRSDL